MTFQMVKYSERMTLTFDIVVVCLVTSIAHVASVNDNNYEKYMYIT